MRTIINKFWTEPAYCVAVLVGLGELVLQTVSLPNAVERPAAALIALLGGGIIRSRVTPVAK